MSAGSRRVTCPHMGHLYLGMRAIARRAGVEYIEPPRPNKACLELGAKYSPEFACLPLKVNVGTYIQALEQGADTLIQGGGTGPCRFGYYGEVQTRILRKLGYDFELLVVEAPDNGDWKAFAHRIRAINPRLGWLGWLDALLFGAAKVAAADRLEAYSYWVRPRETELGATSAALKKALEWIDEAASRKLLKQAEKAGRALLEAVPINQAVAPPKLLLVGEIYVVLEPFVNMNAPVLLGELGIEVTTKLCLSSWVREHLLLGPLGLGSRRFKLAAKPFLGYPVGGEGLESVGYSVMAAREGIDGIVHLMPFTCMPETIAASALDRIGQLYEVPILRLVFDEQTGEAGVKTRLEAFADLLKRCKVRN